VSHYKVVEDKEHPYLKQRVAAAFGYVMDEEKIPIPGAEIYVDSTTKTVSDEVGMFEVRFPSGEHSVRFIHDGHENLRIKPMAFKTKHQVEFEVVLMTDTTWLGALEAKSVLKLPDNPSLNKADRAERLLFRNRTYDVYHAYPERDDIRFFWSDERDRLFGSIGHVSDWCKARGEALMFATNGGMFHSDQHPVGLYVERGERHVELDRGGGEGNFYLKPNGVFAITDDTVYVMETGAFTELEDSIVYATQSGPMLVIDGKLHPKFNEGSPNQLIRSGVGVDGEGRIVFAISNEPVNFYSFGMLFKEQLGCENALYLDGTISQFYIPEVGRYDSTGRFGCMIGVCKKE